MEERGRNLIIRSMMRRIQHFMQKYKELAEKEENVSFWRTSGTLPLYGYASCSGRGVTGCKRRNEINDNEVRNRVSSKEDNERKEGESIMKWKQFRLKTTTQAEDIVSSMLADLGIEGVQIEDKIPLTEQDKEQMFVDILPDIPDDDGTAYLTFYLDEEEDVAPVLMNVRKRTGRYACIS